MMQHESATTSVRTSKRTLPLVDRETPKPAKPASPARPARPSAAVGTLVEFRHYHPRTGHPDWPSLAREARELAIELRPKLARPPSSWADRGRRLASYRTAASNFATNLKLAREGREDLRPLYFIWTLLRSCNFTCDYCDDHQGRKYPELSNDGVLDTESAFRLLRIMRTRTPSLYFAGGEPTMRKDLPELTREAHELGYYPIIINTNGSLIDRLVKNERYRTWLADTDVIVFSLDALDLATLEKMWAYRRPQEVIKNLFLLRELADEMGVKLMINTVIQPGRVRHARDVLDLACDLGIWFTPVPVNVGPTVHQGLLEDAEYRELAELIQARKRDGHRITGSPRMLRRLLRAEPLDCRNTLKPHIDFDGKLLWPCKACVNVPPEHVDVLAFEDVDTLYAHASSLIEPTRFHGSGKNQCGANCGWAQNYSTDAYAHGLRHPISLLGEMSAFLRVG